MRIKITGGTVDHGVVVGNVYNKYSSRNPIVQWMMKGFESSLLDLVQRASPQSIHEIGCGEGYWVLRWNEQGYSARGCDVSKDVLAIARENAAARKLPASLFESHSIYDLDASRDHADLIVCCEVLEHLEFPEVGLQALQRVVRQHLIVSVPQEPLWRVLNLARGKYLSGWGNTPGHVQHWSRGGIVTLVTKFFEVVEIKTPLPWTMLLCRPRR